MAEAIELAFIYGAVAGALLMVAVYAVARPKPPARDAKGRFVKVAQ